MVHHRQDLQVQYLPEAQAQVVPALAAMAAQKQQTVAQIHMETAVMAQTELSILLEQLVLLTPDLAAAVQATGHLEQQVDPVL